MSVLSGGRERRRLSDVVVVYTVWALAAAAAAAGWATAGWLVYRWWA